MQSLPERIDNEWIATLSDEDLVDIETQLYDRFTELDNRHKKLRGSRYVLLRGPADLVDAWDRWNRLGNAARARSLIIPRRKVRDDVSSQS